MKGLIKGNLGNTTYSSHVSSSKKGNFHYPPNHTNSGNSTSNRHDSDNLCRLCSGYKLYFKYRRQGHQSTICPQDNRNTIRESIAVETLSHCIVWIKNLDVATLLDTGAASNSMIENLVRKLYCYLQELHHSIAVKGAWSEPTIVRY